MTIPHPDASEANRLIAELADLAGAASRLGDRGLARLSGETGAFVSGAALQLAEQRAEIAEKDVENASLANECVARAMERDGWRQKAHSYATQLAAANVRIAQAEEVIEFYANPEIYKPHSHGVAFDRRDVSYAARAWRNKEGT